MRSTSSARADRNKIGVWCRLRILRHTDKPSSPGSITSSTTKSGGSRSTAARAKSPVGSRADAEAVLFERIFHDPRGCAFRHPLSGRAWPSAYSSAKVADSSSNKGPSELVPSISTRAHTSVTISLASPGEEPE